MAEYIEREAAVAVCCGQYKECLRKSDMCGDTVAWNICFEIKQLPTADVAPVRHGRWEIIKSNGLSELCRCSACGENDRHACYTTLPYCCHCGAKMAEEKIDLEDTE